jgi:thiamine biosynthesis lipoprotein
MLRAVAILVCVAFSAQSAQHRLSYTHPSMGTVFSITLYAEDETKAQTATDAAFARIDEINRIASDYIPDSELSRFNLAPIDQDITVSADLFALIAKSTEIAKLTDGAFDITAAHAVQQWRRAKRKGQLPAREETKRAVLLTDWQAIQINAEQRTITKTKLGMMLDLGGIGKGYAADEALSVLRKHGLPRAVVAGSGDLAIGNPPPDTAGWDITIRTFEKAEEHDRMLHLTLKNCGCSTSGDLHQFLELNGTRYSHIIDPKTGLGLTTRIACTVIAPSATTSDTLATAMCVMGTKRGLALAAEQAEIHVRFALLQDVTLSTRSTSGFPRGK